MKKYWSKALGFSIAALFLNACHYENPLKTQPVKESALFLVNASANVEKRLKFSIQKDAYGFAYLECMDGKKSIEIRCDELYQGMLRFAKENHFPRFNNMTLADLTNQQVFQRLADDYAEIAATTWPHYFPEVPL